MLLALAVLDERFDTVIVQAEFVAHVGRFDADGTAARRVVDAHQCRSQEIIEGIAERCSPGLAFPFDSCHDIVIQGDGRSDAHDAFSLASRASRGLLQMNYSALDGRRRRLRPIVHA